MSPATCLVFDDLVAPFQGLLVEGPDGLGGQDEIDRPRHHFAYHGAKGLGFRVPNSACLPGRPRFRGVLECRAILGHGLPPSHARSSAMVFPPRLLPLHTCLHIQHRPHGQQLGLQELHVLALLASVHLNREPAGLMLEKVHISTSGTDHRPAKIPMLSVATTHNHVIVSPTVHKYASCPRPKQFDPQRASCTGKQWSHMCVTVRRMAKSSWRIGACMQMQTHGGATWACHPHPPTLARRTRGPSPPARR